MFARATALRCCFPTVRSSSSLKSVSGRSALSWWREPDLHGARARGHARRDTCEDDHHADAVLRAGEARAGRVGLEHVIATSIKEYLPAVLRVLFTILKEKKEGHRIRLAAGDLWMADLIPRAHGGSAQPSVSVGPDDPAVILSSGGTTGTPKGVVGLHRHYVAAGRQLEVDQVGEETVGGRHHAATASLSRVRKSLFSRWPSSGRTRSRSCESSRHRRPAENDRHSQAGVFNGVPTLYTAILNHPEVRAGKIDLSSIKLCFSGSAALMAETKRQFEEKPALASLRSTR